MENKKNIEENLKKSRELYIKRYEALFINDDHILGNKLEKKFTKIEELLILDKDGKDALYALLDDEYDLEINDIIAYIENTKPLTKEGLIQAIDEIFKKWFGYDLYSRDAKALKEVASKILAEIQAIKTK